VHPNPSLHDGEIGAFANNRWIESTAVTLRDFDDWRSGLVRLYRTLLTRGHDMPRIAARRAGFTTGALALVWTSLASAYLCDPC
jgi:hypothetical protein